MEVEIISREVIKPSKPTPPHCKTYNISILDQCLPGYYIPVLLWYQSPESIHDNNNYINDNLPNHLKSSLSNVLAHYYPLAGRVKDTVSIDCNDDGVLFVEARVKNQLKLADILAQPFAIEPPSLDLLYPNDLQWKDPGKGDTLLAVQLSRFDCGGFSIGICLSHKIADACTVSNFLNDWTALARQSADSTSIGPVLNGASLFPPDNQLPEMSDFMVQGHNFVTKRFVFPCTKISELKTIISADGSCNPTRVEVVNSVLFRSIVKGRKKSSPCIFTLGINMRNRMVPKLPTSSMGNFLWSYTVPINKDDHDNDNIGNLLGPLVVRLKDELKKTCEFARNSETKDWMAKSMELLYQPLIRDPTIYICAVGSWCRFPFYEMDFGLGKPVWVSTTGHSNKNNIILIDTADGQGIEAWVTSDAELMATLEGDQDLLKFAMLNPSIVL